MTRRRRPITAELTAEARRAADEMQDQEHAARVLRRLHELGHTDLVMTPLGPARPDGSPAGELPDDGMLADLDPEPTSEPAPASTPPRPRSRR